MADIEKIFDLYDLLHTKYAKQDFFENIRKHLASKFLSLYNKKKTIYDRRKSEELKSDIEKILTWLIKEDSTNKAIYNTFLRDFLLQVTQAKREQEGKPSIKEFKADNKYIISGMEVELSWVTFNASKIELFDNGDVVLTNENSFTNLTPFAADNIQKVRYKLRASNAYGFDEDEIEIVVYPVPYLDVISVPLSEFNTATNLSIDVSIPELGDTDSFTELLKKVSFYPPQINALYNNDTIETEKYSIFNIYSIYGRIRRSLGKRRR